MEIWFLLFGLAFIVCVVANAAKSSSSSSSATPASPAESPFSARLEDTQLKTSAGRMPAKEIQIRGAFPGLVTKRVAIWISILDENTGVSQPVLCAIDNFQETDSPAYFAKQPLGEVSPGHGIPEWRPISPIFPEIMVPPHGGRRELTVVVRLIDVSAPPVVELGFLKSGKTGILWAGRIKFTHTFTEKGYLEAAKHRDEAQILTLKIAMAVAMSDGGLHEQEGRLMQRWIRKSIASFSGQKETDMKEIFNRALQESYAEAKRGTLSLTALADRLNDIGETGNKYHALELSADVMAADGIAHVGEIKALNNLAELLGLDVKRVAEIMDTRMIKLDPANNEGAGAEYRIGIKPDWSVERIKKYLRDEFGKWNNRINTLPEGKQRDNAQRMLDDIAVVRKKYDG